MGTRSSDSLRNISKRRTTTKESRPEITSQLAPWPHGGGRIASERHSAKFFCVRHQSGFANKFVDFNANPNTDHAAVDEMTYVVRTSG